MSNEDIIRKIVALQERTMTLYRKTDYGEVSKGTKRRAMLQLFLQPRGLSSKEALRRGLITQASAFAQVINRLEDDFGYSFKIIKRVKYPGKGTPLLIYRIVARFYKDGTLKEDYVKP